jgi:hypothetical protein
VKLACPSCGENGSWTVAGSVASLTLPGGEQVAIAAGACRRCLSRVWFEPSEDAVREIGAREDMTRTRVAQLRRTLAAEGA